MLDAFRRFFNKTKEKDYRRWAKWLRWAALAVPVGIILLFITLSFTDLPSLEELENPRSELATLVYAANGEVLGKYYTENRVPVNYEDLSPHLVDALIATEDERYRNHSGIDFEALGRVGVKTVIMRQRSSGGASTITQQLAKLLFTGTASKNIIERIVQKLKEWIIAVRLEKRYTKDEILTMYLNKFSFINGAYGIKAASEIYFNKSPKNLSINEAATLVGMLKNPSLYNPLRRPERVVKRRMVVLNQMRKNGYLDQVAYDSLKQKPLGLDFQQQTHIDGLAPYFRMEVAKDLRRTLDRPELRKSDGSKYNIYRDGLRVYTTIDPLLQEIAEEEMTKHMEKVQDAFWKTWRNLDPWTYKDNDSEIEISVERRARELELLVRRSESYQNLRATMLEPLLKEIQANVTDARFSIDDHEIDWILAMEKDGNYLSRMVNRNELPKERAAKYRKIFKSEYFPRLKVAWDKLQARKDEIFSTPREMKVFAYNEKMEKDTVMTPMDSIRYHRMFLQTGIVAMDPNTGHVKVWVGGIDHKYFQYDHVRINRQIGSTVKPFVYATAIDKQGYSPCYKVYDLPVTIGPGDGAFGLEDSWTPDNSDGEFTGELLTLRKALQKSKNTVSAHLMKQLGSAEPVRDLMRLGGIEVDRVLPNGALMVPPAPALALGSCDLSVLDMTAAYTTFANDGIAVRPVFITRIEDKNGIPIYEDFSKEQRVLRSEANYVMVDLLRSAATGMWGINGEIGGKTGTTNDYVDGWFMGVSPNLVVGTWVGGEDRWIRFRSLAYGSGSYMAKPFFRSFVKRLEEKEEETNFPKFATFYRPSGALGIELNCDLYDNPQTTPASDSTGVEDIFGDEVQEEDEFGER